MWGNGRRRKHPPVIFYKTAARVLRLANTEEFMKTKSRQKLSKFQLAISPYGNFYYVERIRKLEAVLARKPREVLIEMVGIGEIPADSALLMRSVLMNRSPKTRIVTNARSSLQGASVLVWLMGDRRLIRGDARLFFRQSALSENGETKDVWKDDAQKSWDSSDEIDPEEADYAKVLQAINEFLPVRELAGRLIHLPILRQFGLVENEKVDGFLANAFAKSNRTMAAR